jgi:hypothetical protein
VGLDASVACRCLADGLAEPPPVAIRFDQDGWPAPVDARHDGVFAAWLAAACEHPQLELAVERIGDWSAVATLARVLELALPGRTPVLLAELPWGSGGSVSHGAAAQMLAELAELRRAEWQVVGLRDLESGEVVRWHEGLLVVQGEHAVALTERATLVVSDRRSGECLFEASELEQRPRDRFLAVLRDPVSGRELDPAPTLRGEGPRPLPTRLRVERIRQDWTAMRGTVEALERVCRASVATGNPVRWSGTATGPA